ncbi:primosomal protein N' [Capnocytophaga granulosa]|uniref:replication restart helicase PriA n=1 Tax=Capnocytophaga granulosa TaxID=45242 RepID=UPI0028EF165A|nr:primosomal protein N' [Capnocytophaga granulosa]
MHYIDVVLPLPLRPAFTYEVNEEQAAFLQAGMRVVVPFGKSKIYTAITIKVHEHTPSYPTKPIEFILDEAPVLSPRQLQLFAWASSYYLGSFGELLKIGMPSSLLLESETMVERTEQTVVSDTLSDDEFLVYEALGQASSLSTKEVGKILQKKNPIGVLKTLIEKGVVRLSEKIFEKYQPKLQKYLRLTPTYQGKEALNALLDGDILKTKAQQKLLWAFVALRAQKQSLITAEMLLEKAEVGTAVLKKVIDYGVLEVYTEAVDRVSFASDSDTLALSPAQEKALQEIEASFAEKNTVLLHGVASSGKTQIYSKLIEQTLAQGKQVLYLLPEVGISVQLTNRLEHFFGDQMSVYHNKYSTHERVEVWNNVLAQKEKAQFVLGVRTAVFLPFHNLGLVIVDEEHDLSYKQAEGQGGYQVRDVALMLAHLHGAKTLLGSATPSAESYYNAQIGKYSMVRLTDRFASTQPPQIELIDLKEKTKKKETQGHFSDTLLEAMTQTLAQGKQVILLQNRRGYAPYLQCEHCDTIPQCPHCDVSLTYHQLQNQLCCHYCGYTIVKPVSCPACQSYNTLQTKGLGTEKVEEELMQFFPKAHIDRMDMDTTRGKYSFEKIIHRLEKGETDILVGTQMVSKGLDFPRVGLVGIMNADIFLYQQDFRALERGYQLLTHIAGRAGRKDSVGQVLIQTYNPFQEVLQQVKDGAYQQMIARQLQERQDFHYPPFYRLIRIIFKHKEQQRIDESSHWFAESLRLGLTTYGVEVLGAEYPPISRIRNEYIKYILLKIPPKLSPAWVKEYILRVEQRFFSVAVFRSVQVSYNVDI